MSDGPDRSLEMFTTALDLEKKGKVFYEKAVSTCQNDLGREIFRMLMKEEIIHMDRILKIYESLRAGEAWSEDWRSIKPDHKDLGSFFKEMAAAHGKKIAPTTSDLEALDVGVDFELRAISFYQEHLAKTTDPLEQEFLEEMVAEEKTHHVTLSDMKLYLSDPAAWFLEQEHPGLDGA